MLCFYKVHVCLYWIKRFTELAILKANSWNREVFFHLHLLLVIMETTSVVWVLYPCQLQTWMLFIVPTLLLLSTLYPSEWPVTNIYEFYLRQLNFLIDSLFQRFAFQQDLPDSITGILSQSETIVSQFSLIFCCNHKSCIHKSHSRISTRYFFHKESYKIKTFPLLQKPWQ